MATNLNTSIRVMTCEATIPRPAPAPRGPAVVRALSLSLPAGSVGGSGSAPVFLAVLDALSGKRTSEHGRS